LFFLFYFNNHSYSYGSGGGGRNEETKRKVACAVHNDVRGRDVVDGFGTRVGWPFSANEAKEMAVNGTIGTTGDIAYGGEDGSREVHRPWKVGFGFLGHGGYDS